MNIKCPNLECGIVIAKVDRRKKQPKPEPQNGSSLDQRDGMAPRLRCGKCRNSTVLLSGSI